MTDIYDQFRKIRARDLRLSNLAQQRGSYEII